MRIEPFSELQKNDWDDFVWRSNNGTLFHTRRFLSYHPADRFKDASLVFYKENQILALLPATEINRDGQKILSSHQGASYGGFVALSPLSVKDAFLLVENLQDYARQEKYDGIDMTLPPQIYLNRPNNYIEFAMVKNGFTYRKREISSVIPLDFSVDEILNTFNPSSRRAVRRAKKQNVFVEQSNQYETFYEILKRNLKMRHQVTPTHTVEELLKLKDLFPERIKLFAAFAGETMVAGVVMFICNSNVALAFYISHNEEYQHFRGVNLLFYEIIKWCIEKKYRFLDYGIFTVNMEPNWGLGRFKESFGAQGVFRDSFVKMF